MRFKDLTPEKKWIIIGIPVLLIIGSLVHFLYDFSSQNEIIGLFSPVNESVWEHLKMVVLPIILWWSIYYFTKGEEYNIDNNKWFTSALISLLVALISIPLMHYFYTSAFGIESVVVDIIILFISILLGQLLALHYYNYGNGINYVLAILIMVIIIGVFMYFTFNPPHLPLFIDSETGQSGI
jgi:hypothetical protein